jgi:hypothetical protein
MTPLPLPVRLAAGLVATAVEQARDLPRHVIEFPVTAVSQALQVSMRVQQRVTELAIKGDRALGALRPVEEQPGWATFDEDLPTNGHPAVSTVTELRPAPRPPAQRSTEPTPARPAPAERASAESVSTESAPTESGPTQSVPDRSAPTESAPTESAPTESAPAESAPAQRPEPATAPGARPTGPAEAAERIASAPVDEPAAEPTTGPGALPGYATMSIAQLRGKLRSLSLDELQALLAWERTHDDRPAYVTMLSNRITTVSEG